MATEYNSWNSIWRIWRGICQRNKKTNRDDFYTDLYHAWKQRGVTCAQAWMRQHGMMMADFCKAETVWLDAGSPYYNVHPQMLPRLLHTNLSVISADLVEMPDNEDVVVINLPKGDRTFPGASVPLLKQLTKDRPGRPPPEDIPEDSFIESILVARTPKKDKDFAQLILFYQTTALTLFNCHYLDSGSSPIDINWPISTGVLDLLPEPIDTVFARMVERTKADATQPNRDHVDIDTYCGEVVAKTLRLLVAIGFLKNSNSEVVSFDVLRRDQDKYLTTNDEGVKQAAERAARDTGRIGWNVGNDMIFDPEWYRSGAHKSCATGTRGPLEWAHIRGGHPHAVRYGPGKTRVKIMFFRPIVVRKDRPFKEDEGL